MTRQEVNHRVDEAFREPGLIQAAIERGIADAARQYAQAGELMASWVDGRIVLVDPVTFQEVEPNRGA